TLWNDHDREPENPPGPGHRPLGGTADTGLAAAAEHDPLGRAAQGRSRCGGQWRPVDGRRGVRALRADDRGIRQLAALDRSQRHAGPARDADPALSRSLRAPAAFLRRAEKSRQEGAPGVLFFAERPAYPTFSAEKCAAFPIFDNLRATPAFTQR